MTDARIAEIKAAAWKKTKMGQPDFFASAWSWGADNFAAEIRPEVERLESIEHAVAIGITRGREHLETCTEDHDHRYIEGAIAVLSLALGGKPILSVDAPAV